MGPAILAGLEEAVKRGWLHGISFNVQFHDTQCNAALATQAWEDLLVSGLPHVVFGPACDTALLPVAQQLHVRKVPLVTAGGMASAFSQAKTQPGDQFYMLTRTGASYRDLARTALRFMDENGWGKFLLAYASQEHSSLGGDYSCGFLKVTL